MQVVIAVLAVLTMLGFVVTRSRKLVIALVIFAGLICGPFFPNLIVGSRRFNTPNERSSQIVRECVLLFWSIHPEDPDPIPGFLQKNGFGCR